MSQPELGPRAVENPDPGLPSSLTPQDSSRLTALARWIEEPHPYPLDDDHRRAILAARAELESSASGAAQPAAHDPLLVVALLGGSGVGKSTLFNALAGAPVAAVSGRRPTTTEPTAYVHAEVPESRLSAYGPLRRMRIERHRRPGLRNKVIIDAPDFDTREAVQAHRQVVLDLLPFCDLLLFVASPDKYADRAGWELLLQRAPRHAVAFVLTKLDTIDPHGSESPEADWLRMVAELGYPEPRLFRVRAAEWFEYRARRAGTMTGGDGAAPAIRPPHDDDFIALEHWLEDELRRDDVARIQAQVRQRKLGDLIGALERARPPQLAEPLAIVWGRWHDQLDRAADELSGRGEAALRPLLPYLEADRQIALHQQYRGVFGLYLAAADLVRYGPMLLGRWFRGRAAGPEPVLLRSGGIEGPVPAIPLGADVRELLERLRIDLHLGAAEVLGRAAGPVPARWIGDGLKATGDDAAALVGRAIDDCLSRLLDRPAAGPVVRAGRTLLRWTVEVIPGLFLLWCGWLLAKQFWRGEIAGVGFLLHAAALLLILCAILHVPVALFDSLPRLSDRQGLRRWLQPAIRHRLAEPYRHILDALGQAAETERRRIDGLIAGLESQVRLAAQDRGTALDALFAGAIAHE